MRYFQHADALRSDYPQLVAGAVFAAGIDADADAGPAVERYTALAQHRLLGATEGEFPEVRAWRRAFADMGLKPTQYRCAAEALLRRLRKEGSLPRIHPVIDLCNAISAAYAIPVAVLDADRVAEPALEVRYAKGDETYLTFSGETESPAPGEVTYADSAGRAHARRWTNRQSGYSAVGDATRRVLIVAEAMHESAAADVPGVVAAVAAELTGLWHAEPVAAVLSGGSPRFEF